MSLNAEESHHWADHAATHLISSAPNQDTYVCASGISPSGMVHIGNFREVVTTEFVVRALRERGKKVRFLYFWDDYDAFRKVPEKLPNPEKLKQELRKPLTAVWNPFESGQASYAAHFEKDFESEIAVLGIKPEFVSQTERYEKNAYTKGIEDALNARDVIVSILNTYRTSPLENDWTPISVYCKKCKKDTTEKLVYRAPTSVDYSCTSCKENFTVDFSKEKGVKLLWRVDWPMRWAFEKVDFEPGGKDHSSTGGSFDTGKAILKAVWKREPPFYVQYDFVIAKGRGNKLSSSSGNLITLSEALAVYEPEVVRWIFASRKPNLDFAIAFDLDVIKAYDDFDRCERIATGSEDADEKKRSYETRIYQLSQVEPQSLGKTPLQFSFRHLCNVLQIFQGDLNKTKAFYNLKIPKDEERLLSRATRAWHWLQNMAPEEFRFQVRDEKSPPVKITKPELLAKVAEVLEKKRESTPSEEVLSGELFEVMKGSGLNAKQFFPEIYLALIGKESGPKLASFLLAIGLDRAAKLMK